MDTRAVYIYYHIIHNAKLFILVCLYTFHRYTLPAARMGLNIKGPHFPHIHPSRGRFIMADLVPRDNILMVKEECLRESLRRDLPKNSDSRNKRRRGGGGNVKYGTKPKKNQQTGIEGGGREKVRPFLNFPVSSRVRRFTTGRNEHRNSGGHNLNLSVTGASCKPSPLRAQNKHFFK